MTAVSLDGGSLISALWKGRRFDLEGRSLGNHLTWLPHFRDGDMRSRDAYALLKVTQLVGVTAAALHTSSGSRSSLRSPAPLAAGRLHSTLLERCWPGGRRSLGVQPRSTLSPQHVYGPGEFKFMEAEKCSSCSLPWPVVWTGQMKRNFLWFCLELFVPPPVVWGYWRQSRLVLTLYDYVQGLCVVAIQLWDPWSLTLGLSSEGVLTWLTYFPM